MKKVVFSFSKLPIDLFVKMNRGLHEVGYEVVAIASHDYDPEIEKNTGSKITWYSWNSYNQGLDWTANVNYSLFQKLINNKYSTILPMFERYGPFNTGTMDVELRMLYDFSVAELIIKKHQPDIIIFSKQPESGLEYFLYLLAKEYSIEVRLTRFGLFTHSRVVTSDIEAPVVAANGEISHNIYKLSSTISEVSPLTKKYINEITKLDQNYIPPYEKNKVNGVTILKATSTLIKSIQSPRKFASYVINRNSGPIFKRALYKSYLRRISAVSDISSPSIYFPLHYQPELTTMPLGYEYVNQIKAIKLLSDKLPDNATIYVKEHPSVFSESSKVNKAFRPYNYYEWLARIPKVKLVDLSVSSLRLQIDTNATACITGSAGLESMLRGKPVIIFGAAAYENAPGVFKFEDLPENIDLDELLRFNQERFAEVDSFVEAFESVSYQFGEPPTSPDAMSMWMQNSYVRAILASFKNV
ncbi:hypothetical protein IDSA_01150 [Pseudidiomarina salinarum]|uniref:Capsule biosynthesis protein n=1 Tax=Pseudidiomarina salinarum TaxID=435908 RepID=A0A094L995_9GAMM|nr:hypothetical protein [Pseudidiomarina salinarum]KFZ31363.1 hypothetical protein IDSA_01150 [Pseudidiomarina salinarum]RUO70878.1 hypothetical protein CWI79_05415 [Pseudidiomarina salinarum]